MKAPTRSNAARTANRGRRASGRRDGGVAHFRELTRVELPRVPRFSQSHLKPPFALFGPLDLRTLAQVACALRADTQMQLAEEANLTGVCRAVPPTEHCARIIMN